MKKLIAFVFSHFTQINKARDGLQAKRWYLSRTVWFNLLTLSASAGVFFLGPQFGVSEAEVNALSIAIVNAVNIALRFITTQPISVASNTVSDNRKD